MTIRDPKELRCWQLADRVRAEVIAICAKPAAARDFRFCNGFKDAAGSVCRNISEGFRRYQSGQIVQFFTFGLASLGEVVDYLTESRKRNVITDADFLRLTDDCDHVRAMMLRFMKPHPERTGTALKAPGPRKRPGT
jgi:four helix bundle protein